MATSLDQFKALLREVAGISKYALAGVTALPLVTLAVDLSPPWPRGVSVATSLLELIVLVLAYHYAKGARRVTINRALAVGSALLVVASLAYFTLLSLFSYEGPSGERFVKGYECTAAAKLLYESTCPLLPKNEIASANYAADRLWTSGSIVVVRVSLLITWSAASISANAWNLTSRMTKIEATNRTMSHPTAFIRHLPAATQSLMLSSTFIDAALRCEPSKEGTACLDDCA